MAAFFIYGGLVPYLPPLILGALHIANHIYQEKNTR